MRTPAFLTLLLFFRFSFLFSQSAPISIDGKFADWPGEVSGYMDTDETVSNVDLLSFQVTNDEEFLFLKIVLGTALNLKENDPIAHSIYLYIDTDDNASTGFNVQEGFGSELGINFSNLSANFDVSPPQTINFADIRLRIGPTVTSTEFEIAIARDAVPDNIHALFSSPTIKILFKNWHNGDVMPNEGAFFSYTFDNTPVEPLVPTTLEKENPSYLRTVAYNTLFDGLLEPARLPHFEKVMKALNPDIIGFSECYDTPAATVASLLNNWLPLGNSDGWQVVKKGDLITASRWPVLQTWPFITRSFPVLIDLSGSYPRNLLFTNAHLSCCAKNSERQSQVDEYVSFLLQLKEVGAGLGFTEFTPFIYAGDLNLVGYAQQLTTLLTGDIQNVNQFGPGGPLDWDGSDLTDQICRQTDKRMAYTWRNDQSPYPPGRLDFMIYSDKVMNAEKSFSLQTEVMSADRLALYNLNANDTGGASDHFPVVTDFSLLVIDEVSETDPGRHKLYPNPVGDELTIELAADVTANIIVSDALGNIAANKRTATGKVFLEMGHLPAGIYFVQVEEKDGLVYKYKFMKP